MDYRRIGLYGISSTGKTTVAKVIEQIHPQYKFIDGSEIIDTVCPGGLEAFKRFSDDEKTNYRHLAIEYMIKLQQELQRHFVIAGHYSFITKSGEFEIAWTEADEKFYTDIFIFTSTPEIIYERNKVRGIDYSFSQIKNWQDFEIHSINKLTHQKIFINQRCSIKDSALFVLENINRSLVSGEIEKILTNEEFETYFLFDADGTLIPFDSAAVVSNYLNKSKPAEIKQLFKKFQGYCFEAFFDVASHFTSNNTIELWEKAMDQASTEISLNNEFIDIIQNGSCGKIILSAGFTDLWRRIVFRNGYSNVHVIAGNSLFDNYIITDENKGEVVDFLKKKGKNVISFGDSLVDRYMLQKSDLGIYVVYDRIKNVSEHLKNQNHIKYVSFNLGIELNNMTKTNMNEIATSLKLN